MGKKSWGPSLALAGSVASALAAYILYLRPRLARWGTSVAEARRGYPGDDLVPHPRWSFTHAVTIEATPPDVWPWLVQRGYRRGGWYTYDRLYELMGAADFVDGRSACRVIPELQGLKVGDTIPFAPGIDVPVVALQPGRLLLLHAEGDPSAPPGTPPDPCSPGYMNVSWGWFLDEIAPGVTRLVDRARLDYARNPVVSLMQRLFIEPGAFILDRKMLLGIKQRAEGRAGCGGVKRPAG